MRAWSLMWVVCAAACGNRGSVTFAIHVPSMAQLNPFTGRPSEIAVKKTDGTLVGVATQSATSEGTLSLGALVQMPVPSDLELTLTSGSDLLGMARIRDVTILNGVAREYVAEIRKPLFTIGSTLPEEMVTGNLAREGQVKDPTTGRDLAALGGPQLPKPTTAAAATWDGRFIIAAGSAGLVVTDTGSGQTIGVAPLAFTANRVVAGPRDTGIVALDPAGAVAIYVDEAALVQNPGGQAAMSVPLGDGARPRTAVFAPSGRTIYVLTGGGEATDPCTAQAAPPPNTIVAVGLDGVILGTWSLPGFVTDLAVDGVTGRLALSDPLAGQVALLAGDEPFGSVTPTKLVDATCPSALRVAKGEVFVVTTKAQMRIDQDGFTLLRAPLSGAAPTEVAFDAPAQVFRTDRGTSDGNAFFSFQIYPGSLAAYEMAITPDASRIVFASKALYRQRMQRLELLGTSCTADFELVEYGSYEMDTRSGQSSYVPRAQIVVSATGRKVCVSCASVGIDFVCSSDPGDRAAGITAVFGAP